MARHRDIVVVGTSAGGMEALSVLFAGLPRGLGAAVLVVQHLSPRSTQLAAILGRGSALPVDWARDGEQIAEGRVYLAPPDAHLMIEGRRILLGDGTRENHSRPAINRLFRSAATAHGSSVVAVVLTGMLDDGAVGAAAVRRCGGVVLVQDPADAAFPAMPENAIRAAAPDEILPLGDLPSAIVRRVAEEVAPVPVPPDLAVEAELDRSGRIDASALGAIAEQSPLSCPECGGPTWALGTPRAASYRCYLGHATSAHTLLAMKGAEVERSLWAALRALEERAATYGRLAIDAAELGTEGTAALYRKRAAEAQRQVAEVRQFLTALRAELPDDRS
jgi:two-component system chemotaxis response regulator CheB